MIRLLAVAAIVLAACGPSSPRPATGLHASASASGAAKATTGSDPYDMTRTTAADGTIDVKVTDVGDRWSHLENTDLVDVHATLKIGSDAYDVTIDRAMPRHPLDRYTTWFGVALGHEQHGDTGIGTSKLPRVSPDIALWGWAHVRKNGQDIAISAPAHVMVTRGGPLKGVMLLVNDEDKGLLGAPDGYLSVSWPAVAALSVPSTEQAWRHFGGLGALLMLFAAFLWLARTESPVTAA